MNQTNPPDLDFTSITADIVSSYVANNAVHPVDLPSVIASVHAALQGLVAPKQAEPAKQLQPSIAIRKSVTPDFLVSLEDGKKYKTLKRHLGKLGLTPAKYRAKWGLPDDYPIVAPNYALRRSELARSSGLGQQRRKTAAKAVAMSDEAVTAPAEVSKPQRRTPSRKKTGA
jgi:predicted transcriptional regulator